MQNVELPRLLRALCGSMLTVISRMLSDILRMQLYLSNKVPSYYFL